MSFLSVIKSIGRDIEKVVGIAAPAVSTVTAIAEPFIETLNPAAGAVLKLVSTATATVESIITGVSQGVAKKQAAESIITAELPNVQELIAEFGLSFAIPQAELSALIDASVAEKNALAAFVAALKPKPAA